MYIEHRQQCFQSNSNNNHEHLMSVYYVLGGVLRTTDK